MLQLKTVTPQFADFDKVSALYHSAFPENERRPLEEMFSFLSGSGEFLALYDGETFCGFVCLLSWQDITHILYLAIDSQLRGRGYGTGMLSAIRQRYPHSRLIADIELETTGAPNNTERRQLVQYRADDVSFRVMLCIGGCGTIQFEGGSIPFFKGDCIFVPADSVTMTITGQAQFLFVRG